MKASITIETTLGIIKCMGSANTDISIQQGELPLELPNGMVVDKAVAIACSIGSITNCSDIIFSAHLQNKKLTGYPETGEWLDCISWKSKEWSLSIGTEDQEILEQRLPDLFKKERPDPVTYSSSGIEIKLSRIQTTKPISLHFIIALKKLPDNRECSTWFAVDVPHKVVNQAVQSLNKKRETT